MKLSMKLTGTSFFRRKLNYSLSHLLFVLVLCGLATLTTSTTTNEFFGDWQTRLGRVYDHLQERLQADTTRTCECSYHDCGTEPGDEIMECVQSNHDQNLTCAIDPCGHAKVSLDRSFVRTPDDIGFGSYPENVMRDICFTDRLENSFKMAREYGGNEFEPWTYFGSAETGVHRIWPGVRRRNAESSTSCTPYDPRVRPWWRVAGSKPREIVILLSLSETMNGEVPHRAYVRWNLANNMINKFLDTLSPQDYVNIVVFNMSAKALIEGNRLVQANEENINDLKEQLALQRANWTGPTIDIGEALELAFNMFGNRGGNQRLTADACESHILLFTDYRDCVKSSENPCRVREHFNSNSPGAPPYIANGTAVFLEFVENLQRRHTERRGNAASIFTFSLTPAANVMMGQLACRMGGVNVDLQDELGRSSVEPLALMKGYFRRAALSIPERRMVISDFYYDYSGLGRMNTFAMPVFYKARESCPSILYGVIATDMPVADYLQNGIDYDKQSYRTDVATWNEEFVACSSNSVEVNQCHLQVIRDTDSECVYRLDQQSGISCYRYNNALYKLYDDTIYRRSSSQELCTNDTGYMITPKTAKERRFLSTIIPEDGVWIDLQRQGNGTWTWPDREELDPDQAEKLERLRFQHREQAAIMVPRSFDDNFQTVQESGQNFVVCRYDSPPSEEVCNEENTRNITDDDFVDTIRNCDMEDCIFSNVAAMDYSNLHEQGILCNPGGSSSNYSSLACCEVNELEDFCLEEQSSNVYEENEENNDDNDNDGDNNDGAIVVVIICAAIAVFILFACIGVHLYRRGSFNFLQDVSKRNTLLRQSNENNIQLTSNIYSANTSASPFNREAANRIMDGKRPELVVNIEVTLLDNGWEKVGGYGRVRQGEYMDSSGNVHKVAVKFVDALAPNAAWEALKNEFDILASIPMHPNIVKPIGAHWGDRSEKSERYIVEELMHSNLGDLLHGDISITYPGVDLTYRHVINIFIDIAAGLEHLHKHKIIHFDLKPKNVLLDQNLRAKIADFGCSKAKFDTYIALSQMGGTPPYMPPECWMLQYSQGSRTEVARAKIDVYSFGVVMWETLNGGHSIGSVYSQTNAPSANTAADEDTKDDVNSSDVMVQRWEIKYQLSSSVPPTLRDLVNRCVRADFNARPTCLQILDTLRSMLNTDWTDKRILLE